MIKLKSLIEKKYSLGYKDAGSSTSAGPHENKELKLMILNKKPAMLTTDEDKFKLFIPYIKSKQFVHKSFSYTRDDEDIKYYIISLPEESWRIDKIIKLLKWRCDVKIGNEDKRLREIVGVKAEKLYHIKIGTLLGYSKNDILSFINRIK